MNPETMYFGAVALCGFGLLMAGIVTWNLLQRVRRLEAKVRDIPSRYMQVKGVRGGPMIFDEANFYDKETGTGAGRVDEIKAAARRLPKGRGLT